MSAIDSSDSTQAPNMGVIELTAEEREKITREKTTCPFLGPAVMREELRVHNSAESPLARVDDIVALGDSGGGDLGSKVLEVFARGNHSKMLGPSGGLDADTPIGMMSLDLAGSQGAHPGHSGILLGDPTVLNSGRFSAEDFERLANRADTSGRLSTKAVGEFIAENLARDPNSRVLPIKRLAIDLFGLVDELGDSLVAKLFGRKTERDEVELLQKFTQLAGECNLIGSAGEFGLLFAFLANRPESANDDDMGIRLEDVKQMMVEHRLPVGWETWPKMASDWIHATSKIAASAIRAHVGRSFRD